MRTGRIVTIALAGPVFVVACTAASPAPPSPTASYVPDDAGASAAPLDAGLPPPFVLPQPGWQVACQGIDAESCRLMAQSVTVLERPHDLPVRTVLIRCTTPPCTPAEGNGETILIHIDGSSTTYGSWGYGSAMPAGTVPPPPPIPAGDWELACGAVPRNQCEEFAAESFEQIGALGGDLRELAIVCVSQLCTPTAGQIRAIARFADGSEQTVGELEYVGSGP